MDNFFHIIVPFYNVEQWILNCVRSIKAQDYKNFKVTLVNDMSTDKTVEKIYSLIDGNEKFQLIETGKNGGALNSVYTGIKHVNPRDEDVVIVLDGDDWFARKDSLTIVNQAYKENNCLMTYGSYAEYPSGKRGKFSKRLPKSVIDNKRFREYQWSTSHLRTFKYLLWKNIKLKDILNSEGKIYTMAGDLPVMFPMLEMAEERSHYIDEIIHVYNRSNPLNEDKINHSLQLSIEKEVRKKSVYPRI